LSATASYFKSLFPALASNSDARVSLFLGIASESVSSSVWGGLADPATAYLAAHMIAMADKAGASGAAGPVTSSRVGDLARSYADLSSSLDAELASTAYGVEYLRMRRQILVTPMVTC
jgi:hypothetical protein